ncbi:LysM peptidoglycan-binding domain-containing protein [Phytohalomonas tamaricis]|uniref:LysM peptidoglycan-binding domain-containing protein n=1 Tax=Phytohalomonas tamaricis TaxID=2081032 RepID=UPI00131A21CA|nr:LysM domain-containing protein [Phytohalomonas tamaricis]
MISTGYKRISTVMAGVMVFLLLSLPRAFAQQDVTIRSDAPTRYTVMEGDTLWNIAARFLDHPWQWPALWRTNSTIADPDLIYPGDHLILMNNGNAPYLQLVRGEARVIKLSPQMRRLPERNAIEAIELDTLKVFLAAHRVIDPQAIEGAAYVVSGDDQRLVNAAGDRIFVAGTLPAGSRHFGVYMPGGYYRSASGELLGQALIALGEATLEQTGTPLATLRLTRVSREVGSGALILPYDEAHFELMFMPHPVESHVHGRIIATPDDTRVIGARSIVVIGLGQRDGLAPGDVLGVQRQGGTVSDPLTQETLTLPDEEAGTLMVFRSFDRISYALVMRADTPLGIGDQVGAPTL